MSFSSFNQSYWFFVASLIDLNNGTWLRLFFFYISKDVIYTNGYSMHEEHRANPENTRRKKQRKKERKENQSTD